MVVVVMILTMVMMVMVMKTMLLKESRGLVSSAAHALFVLGSQVDATYMFVMLITHFHRVVQCTLEDRHNHKYHGPVFHHSYSSLVHMLLV